MIYFSIFPEGLGAFLPKLSGLCFLSAIQSLPQGLLIICHDKLSNFFAAMPQNTTDPLTPSREGSNTLSSFLPPPKGEPGTQENLCRPAQVRTHEHLHRHFGQGENYALFAKGGSTFMNFCSRSESCCLTLSVLHVESARFSIRLKSNRNISLFMSPMVPC